MRHCNGSGAFETFRVDLTVGLLIRDGDAGTIFEETVNHGSSPQYETREVNLIRTSSSGT
jgi:hypothetical protein